MKEMEIVGCKRISLRKHPWITPETDEIVGEFKVSELPVVRATDRAHEGELIANPFAFRDGGVGSFYADMSEESIVYDWKGNSYCPVRINGIVGYLNTKLLKEKIQND